MPGILWGRIPVPYAIAHVNVYALAADEGWTLVDTGIRTGEAKNIWRGWLKGPLAGPVARLFITHHHPDHIGLAGWLMQETCAPLWMGRLSWYHAAALIRHTCEAPSAEREQFYRSLGLNDTQLDEWRAGAVGFGASCYPLPDGFRPMLPGQDVQMAERSWRLLEGQGHASDHILPLSEDGILIGGDHLLLESPAGITIYPSEPEADLIGEFFDNAAVLLPDLPEDALVLSGHGKPYQNPRAVLARHVARNHRKLTQLRGALAEQKTVIETLPALYSPHLVEAAPIYLAGQAIALCNHLWHRREAERQIGPGGVLRFQMVRERTETYGST